MLNNLNPEALPEFRLYLATVVDVDDPLKHQRIRVTIPELLEGPNATLPWLLPVQSSLFGTGPGYGTFGVPPIGSTVSVHFQGDDLLYGLVFGNTPLQTSNVDPLKENYPRRYGFRDPAGNYFYIDTTPNSTTLEFKHKSGMVLQVSDTGAITVDTPDTLTIKVANNADITVGGECSLAVTGVVTSSAQHWDHTGSMHVGGAFTAESVQDITADVGLATHVHGGISRGGSNTNVGEG